MANETRMDFVKITYELTSEHAAESVAAAGGRGTSEELADLIGASRFRQRVMVSCSAAHIAAMWEQGYRVAAIDACPPPIC